MVVGRFRMKPQTKWRQPGTVLTLPRRDKWLHNKMTPSDAETPAVLHDAISPNIAQNNGKSDDAATRHKITSLKRE